MSDLASASEGTNIASADVDSDEASIHICALCEIGESNHRAASVFQAIWAY